MRTLGTTPIRARHRPPALRTGYRARRGAPSAIGHAPRYTAAYPSTVTHVAGQRGFFGRLCRRATRPPQLTREEQFRLLEIALRIKLGREGKPEDAITLQRPANLPAPPGTPLRQPRLAPIPYDGGRVGVSGAVGVRR